MRKEEAKKPGGGRKSARPKRLAQLDFVRIYGLIIKAILL
jgi:hypothetical protein